jgi:hypothetical protein
MYKKEAINHTIIRKGFRQERSAVSTEKAL